MDTRRSKLHPGWYGLHIGGKVQRTSNAPPPDLIKDVELWESDELAHRCGALVGAVQLDRTGTEEDLHEILQHSSGC